MLNSAFGLPYGIKRDAFIITGLVNRALTVCMMNKIRPYCNSDFSDIVNIYASTKMDELKSEKQNFQVKSLYEKHGFRVVGDFIKEYNGVIVLSNRMEKIG